MRFGGHHRYYDVYFLQNASGRRALSVRLLTLARLKTAPTGKETLASAPPRTSAVENRAYRQERLPLAAVLLKTAPTGKETLALAAV